MRTTLDIDPDILGVIKELAHQRRTTAGKVISELARKALEPRKRPRFRNGIMLLEREPGEPPITMEMVNKWRDEE